MFYDYMEKVRGFEKALRTLETLVFWLCIWLPAGAAAFWQGTLFYDGQGSIEAFVFILLYVGVALFLKTLAFGMAFTVIAIAHNTNK
jgi:hypothetical protein